ncbi:MAG: hypothetical protein QS748_13115 [Candidatus Endonucleobacter bathymodioli]|uniref:Uncharacterized protein n=1 Tax=Candidatus Endonucleibacter bathymodioli TaxID=539814 RepID=A0AA90P2T3_9GAMM|nr:hypothetical protein [Candidatus Endonucleobacter bathymodioli]
MFLSHISYRLKTNIAALSLLLVSAFVQAGNEFVAAFEVYKDGCMAAALIHIPPAEMCKFFRNLDANLSQVETLFYDQRENNLATALCIALFSIGLKGSETDERYFDTVAADDTNKDYDQYQAIGMKYRQDFLTHDMVLFITGILNQPVKDMLPHLSTTGLITTEECEINKIITYVNGRNSLLAQKITAPPEFANLKKIKSTIQMLNPNEMSAIIFNDAFKNILVNIMLSYIMNNEAIFLRTPGTKMPEGEISLALDSSGKYSHQALRERLDEYWFCAGEIDLLELDEDTVKTTASSGINEASIKCDETASCTGPKLRPAALAAISHTFSNLTNKCILAVRIKHLEKPLRISMQTLIATCYSSNQTEFNSNFYGYNQCLIAMTGERFKQSVFGSTSRYLFTILENTPDMQVRAVINQALINLQNFIKDDPHSIINPVMGFGFYSSILDTNKKNKVVNRIALTYP